ncbi:MAG: hypothetical protein ACE5RN_01320 [Nitrosopumilaceae archaeon]
MMDSEEYRDTLSKTNNFECNQILTLDNSIRFVAMCSKNGKMLNVKYRNDVSPLLNEKELLYSIIKSVERNNTRKESEERLGPPIYSVTAYANVKRATITVNSDELVFVSFEGNKNEFTILKKILVQINHLKHQEIL